MPKPNSDLTRIRVRSTCLSPQLEANILILWGDFAPSQLDLSRRRKIAELINRQNETDGLSLDINVSFRTNARFLCQMLACGLSDMFVSAVHKGGISSFVHG